MRICHSSWPKLFMDCSLCLGSSSLALQGTCSSCSFLPFSSQLECPLLRDACHDHPYPKQLLPHLLHPLVASLIPFPTLVVGDAASINSLLCCLFSTRP